MKTFGSIMFSEAAKAFQEEVGARETYERMADREATEGLSQREIDFIASRDSFYLASVTPDGWPYVQHRGGPAGFLATLDDRTLAFGEYRGNKQFVSDGNISVDGRVTLFLMDYPRQARLKILGRAQIVAQADMRDAEKLAQPDGRPPERIVRIAVEAFDWNCPKYITPRFTEREIEMMMTPHIAKLQQRIDALEAELSEAKPTGKPQA